MSEAYKRKVKIIAGSCIESFRTTRINSHLRQLPIESFYSAAARYSGPIALLYRRNESKQIKLPQNYDSNVLFFNCRGEQQRLVPLDFKERVILFAFTLDEQLLIVFATGNYFLIDPATGSVSDGNYISGENDQQKSKDRFVAGELVGDNILLIKEKTMGMVHGLTGALKIFPVVKLHPQNMVFCTNVTTDGDLQVIYLSRDGSIDCLNLSRWEKGSGSSQTLLPSTELRTTGFDFLNLISIAYRNDKLLLVYPSAARFGKPTELITIPYSSFKIQKDDPISKSKTKYRYKNFYQIGFLDNLGYFYDRKRLIFIGSNGKIPDILCRQVTVSASLLIQDQIGLRLIDEHTFIYRRINNPIYYAMAELQDITMECYKTSSMQDRHKFNYYQKLATIYDNYVDHKPIDIVEVRGLQVEAANVWQALLQIAGLYVDPGQQLRLLRFMNFIQNYFGITVDSKRVSKLSKQLRVVNGLRHEDMRRWLTYAQFIDLRQQKRDRFLLLLLRYNMHFVADMVFEDSKSKERIFAHWARCKIQKQSESGALEEIRNRYQQMKVVIGQTIVFTELAKYCLDRNMNGLALKIIQLQPHVGRRCMVFLLIFMARKEPQTVDKLLQYAQQSGEVSAIHQTLQTLRRAPAEWLPAETWLALLPKKPFLEYHYIKMLKTQKQEEQLQKYLTINKMYLDLGYISLGRQFLAKPQMTLQEGKQIIAKDYAKLLVSLSEQLPKIVQRKGMQKLRDLKDKKYPITEEDANELEKDGQFQCLADLIITKDQNIPLAVRVLKKMKSDKIYSILLRRGKIKDAIDEAFARKNKQKLTQLLTYADEDTQLYGKQLYDQLITSH